MSRRRPPTAVDPAQVPAIETRFRAEVARYDLRYRCADCLHLNRRTERCSLGFPVELFGRGPHRSRNERGELVFCKYFELE